MNVYIKHFSDVAKVSVSIKMTKYIKYFYENNKAARHLDGPLLVFVSKNQLTYVKKSDNKKTLFKTNS